MATIWIFGYGSLLWKPEPNATNIQPATLKGWHRDYNKKSITNWGTLNSPGITLGLEEGGECEGVIFKIPEEDFQSFQKREGVTKGFHILSDKEHILVDGKKFTEKCYVLLPNKESTSYIGNLSLDERARMAIDSSLLGGGKRGTSIDYVTKNYETYEKKGVHDNTLKEMFDMVTKILEVNAICGEGIFFQRACAAEIASSTWNIIDIEFPFTYPSTNGPLLGKEGRLDILTSTRIDAKYVVDALVECKQADPKFKKWVFFEKKEKTLGVSVINVAKAESNQTLQAVNFSIFLPKLGYDKTAEYFICYDGRELKNNDINKDHKTQRIEKACLQVSHALRGLINEFGKKDSISLKDKNVPGYKLLIPIVITTAELWTYQWDDTNVRLQDGKIEPEKITLTPRKWLLYEYPLVDYLQVHPSLNDKKRIIFIVNSKNIKEFFNGLKG